MLSAYLLLSLLPLKNFCLWKFTNLRRPHFTSKQKDLINIEKPISIKPNLYVWKFCQSPSIWNFLVFPRGDCMDSDIPEGKGEGSLPGPSWTASPLPEGSIGVLQRRPPSPHYHSPQCLGDMAVHRKEKKLPPKIHQKS